jgi:hypothetical protein
MKLFFRTTKQVSTKISNIHNNLLSIDELLQIRGGGDAGGIIKTTK